MEYSQRLGTITNEQFQKALDHFNLGSLVKTEPIPFGNFGQNVFLSATSGEYVFRGRPHYPWQFRSEQFMAQLLHDKTKTSVPYPYLVDNHTDIFGWSYVIMPKLKGKQLKDKEIENLLSRKDKEEITKAFGENLAEMHTLTWDYSGQYDPDTETVKQFDKPYDEWVIEKINSLVSLSKTYNDKTTKEDATWIKSFLDEGVPALKIPFTPTFVMHDYQKSNMVVDKVHGIWKVTGVFDLMENYFGDSETDLPRMYIAYLNEDKELANIFLKSYIAKHPVRPGFEKRYPIYMLMDRLIVWEWAQRTGKCWWNKNFTFKEWCKPYSLIYV